MELDAPGAHRLEGDLGEGLDVDVPLARDQRLHWRLATVAEADGVAIGLDALDQAELLHVLHDALACLEAIEPRVRPRLRGHASVEADDGANRQPVAAADLEVGGIVTGSDLDDARAEFGIHRSVR